MFHRKGWEFIHGDGCFFFFEAPTFPIRFRRLVYWLGWGMVMGPKSTMSMWKVDQPGGAGCFPYSIWSDFSLVGLKMMTCINFEIMNCTIGTMKHMFNLGAIHQVWVSRSNLVWRQWVVNLKTGTPNCHWRLDEGRLYPLEVTWNPRIWYSTNWENMFGPQQKPRHYLNLPFWFVQIISGFGVPSLGEIAS